MNGFVIFYYGNNHFKLAAICNYFDFIAVSNMCTDQTSSLQPEKSDTSESHWRLTIFRRWVTVKTI